MIYPVFIINSDNTTEIQFYDTLEPMPNDEPYLTMELDEQGFETYYLLLQSFVDQWDYGYMSAMDDDEYEEY